MYLCVSGVCVPVCEWCVSMCGWCVCTCVSGVHVHTYICMFVAN